MPPDGEPPTVVSRGQQAGRLATSEMIRTTSPETGGVQGVMTRLQLVGDLVADQHRTAGMSSDDARKWRFGFETGVGIELGEHLRRLRRTASPASP